MCCWVVVYPPWSWPGCSVVNSNQPCHSATKVVCFLWCACANKASAVWISLDSRPLYLATFNPSCQNGVRVERWLPTRYFFDLNHVLSVLCIIVSPWKSPELANRLKNGGQTNSQANQTLYPCCACAHGVTTSVHCTAILSFSAQKVNNFGNKFHYLLSSCWHIYLLPQSLKHLQHIRSCMCVQTTQLVFSNNSLI